MITVLTSLTVIGLAALSGLTVIGLAALSGLAVIGLAAFSGVAVVMFGVALSVGVIAAVSALTGVNLIKVFASAAGVCPREQHETAAFGTMTELGDSESNYRHLKALAEGFFNKISQKVTLPQWLNWWQIPTAAVVAVGAFILSGWISLSVALCAFVISAPGLFSSSKSESDFAKRTDAVALWSESLRDTMRAARGIEAAIRITSENSALAIRPELVRMNRRVNMGMPLTDALVECADEIANPVFDLIVSVLLNGIRLSPAQVPNLLDNIAQQAREQAHAHLKIHTSRSKQRSQLRLVGIIVTFSSLGFIAAFRTYLEPLATATGQIFLSVASLCVGSLLIWITELSTRKTNARILNPRRALMLRENNLGVS